MRRCRVYGSGTHSDDLFFCVLKWDGSLLVRKLDHDTLCSFLCLSFFFSFFFVLFFPSFGGFALQDPWEDAMRQVLVRIRLVFKALSSSLLGRRPAGMARQAC